jgi:hypothetical protein
MERRRFIHEDDGVKVQHGRVLDLLPPNIRLLLLQAQGRLLGGRSADAALIWRATSWTTVDPESIAPVALRWGRESESRNGWR